MNIVTIRQQVTAMYPYPNWRNKVSKMSDGQVFAIYMTQSAKQAIAEQEAKKRVEQEDELERIHQEALDAAWGYYGQE